MTLCGLFLFLNFFIHINDQLFIFQVKDSITTTTPFHMTMPPVSLAPSWTLLPASLTSCVFWVWLKTAAVSPQSSSWLVPSAPGTGATGVDNSVNNFNIIVNVLAGNVVNNLKTIYRLHPCYNPYLRLNSAPIVNLGHSCCVQLAFLSCNLQVGMRSFPILAHITHHVKMIPFETQNCVVSVVD